MRRRSDPLKLSDTEQEIADLLTSGISYEEMGERLGMSRSNVKYHVTNMRMRFGANKRDELIALLRENYLID